MNHAETTGRSDNDCCRARERETVQQAVMVGRRVLWSLGGPAATLLPLAASSPCPTRVWHSHCPLTCPLLSPLLPTFLLHAVLGGLFCPHLATEHWQLRRRERAVALHNFSDYQPAKGHGFEGGREWEGEERGRGGE